MPRWNKSAKHIFLYTVLLHVFIIAIPQVFGSLGGDGAAKNGEQIARVLSVRKVLRNQYFISRYPQIHYYMLYISLNISDQTYCTEYETPVLDEIADVSSAINQNIKVVVKSKSIRIQAPKGHKFKARVVNGNQC